MYFFFRFLFWRKCGKQHVPLPVLLENYDEFTLLNLEQIFKCMKVNKITLVNYFFIIHFSDLGKNSSIIFFIIKTTLRTQKPVPKSCFSISTGLPPYTKRAVYVCVHLSIFVCFMRYLFLSWIMSSFFLPFLHYYTSLYHCLSLRVFMCHSPFVSQLMVIGARQKSRFQSAKARMCFAATKEQTRETAETCGLKVKGHNSG